jgi:hypothetical protein
MTKLIDKLGDTAAAATGGHGSGGAQTSGPTLTRLMQQLPEFKKDGMPIEDWFSDVFDRIMDASGVPEAEKLCRMIPSIGSEHHRMLNATINDTDKQGYETLKAACIGALQGAPRNYTRELCKCKQGVNESLAAFQSRFLTLVAHQQSFSTLNGEAMFVRSIFTSAVRKEIQPELIAFLKQDTARTIMQICEYARVLDARYPVAGGA